MAKRGNGKSTTFVCDGLAEARTVYLVGDFNDWDPTATRMRKARSGGFRATVALPPGTHHYKFVADGVWMHDPRAAEQEMNQFGTLNSVVRVA